MCCHSSYVGASLNNQECSTNGCQYQHQPQHLHCLFLPEVLPENCSQSPAYHIVTNNTTNKNINLSVDCDGQYKTAPYNTIQDSTVRCNTIQYCTVLYCIAPCLYCPVLYCTVLHCTVLYCTVLYCIVLYGTVLSFIVLNGAVLYCPSQSTGKLIFLFVVLSVTI